MFYYHQIEKPLPHRWLVKRIQTELVISKLELHIAGEERKNKSKDDGYKKGMSRSISSGLSGRAHVLPQLWSVRGAATYWIKCPASHRARPERDLPDVLRYDDDGDDNILTSADMW